MPLCLLQGGKMIQAIKIYRELTGAGLAEAKAAVDQLARQLR
jgi:ribosomal protein L7/L12